MQQSNVLTRPGGFVVGCNYWASHAGTRMWSNWRPELVERDLQLLSRAGLQLLRVFPLWSDFQPLNLLRTGGGAPVEFRHGEEPLPDDECGQAGMSRQAMDRFAQFADLAHNYDLKLLVGLLTGWMSGRLHVPAPFEGLNVLTDPLAIQWELRFVGHFVDGFKDHPAIAGWDLGNECNVMGVATREQAWTWTATICNAIRAKDPGRPVVSGLHGLTPDGTWRMQDQGELTDLLTTHPYPVFTPHCDQDPVNTIRTTMHSTAESRLYADIGMKPCLCQEIGTLGPVIASEQVAADYVNTCLFSLWANDCHGLVWWCANDQTNLEHAPYDWHSVERELGLLRLDGSAKPVLDRISAFRRMLDSLPFERLPLRARHAVCILSDRQDHWAVAYSAFILAKQAGFDIEFQYETQPIREADLYLLPCLTGHRMVSRRRMQELLEKIRAGATLYISLDDGLPSDFEPITGLEPQTRERRREFGPLWLNGIPGEPSIPSEGAPFKVRLKSTRADVIGREEDGNPAFSVAKYGQGKVFFLSVPMEKALSHTPGAFHTDDAPPCWRVYRHIARDIIAHRAVRKIYPMVAVTEHALSADRQVVVAINHTPDDLDGELTLAEGWQVTAEHHGALCRAAHNVVICRLAPNDAAVFEIQRQTGRSEGPHDGNATPPSDAR